MPFRILPDVTTVPEINSNTIILYIVGYVNIRKPCLKTITNLINVNLMCVKFELY